MEPATSVTIALAGNPNAGKTTIFNALTGARQHVGNYPGITVEKKTGLAELDGETIALVDLPGTYSLTAYSQEERVTRRMLIEEKPDVVLHIVDAGALQRNLYLTVQLLELGLPVVIALNMMDEVHRRGDSIDAEKLSRLLNIPIVETIGRTGKGITEALRTAAAVGRANKEKPHTPRTFSYGTDIDPVLDTMTEQIEKDIRETGKQADSPYPARWIALKFLENDTDIKESSLFSAETLASLESEYAKLAKHLEDTLQTYPEATIADFRYGYISGVLRQDVVVHQENVRARRHLSDKIDTCLTHNLIGILCMGLIFYLVYEIAFSLGSIPMDWVDAFFGWLGETADSALPDGLFKSLIVDGIIGGIGGIMTFVPLIFIMFFLIAFLEDLGYMARISYMLDRVFRFFGLHGASIMPYMISGGIAGGCAVPGVMATRTLRSPKEKMATMLTLPFMACGAKIPVFLLLVGAFFPEENQAAIMLSITAAGWILALLSARALRSTLIAGPATPFVMELPPYRLPTLRGLLLHTWERGWQYLKKAGTIILAISIVMWAILTFPRLPDDMANTYAEQVAAAEEQAKTAETALEQATQADKASLAAALEEAKKTVETRQNEESSAKLRYSLAGRIGSVFEPVTRFAGFDWRTNIALLGGFAAKEVLVSTLGTAYSLGEVDPEEADPLSEKIQSDPHWNKANAASLIIFVLIYAPCVVTIAAIKSETGGWRWPLFSLFGSTIFAYLLAVAVYQTGTLLL